MKFQFLLFATFAASIFQAIGAVSIDQEAFGESLGGWKKRSSSAAEYPLSGASYRTYKPEISPTPDGGIFVSVRIDHVRGWLSSDDHANLEITVSSKGAIVSAQSSIAIQGRSIKSDVIVGSNEAGKSLLSPDRAVQIGTDLVSDLSAKLLRENIVEAGRVSFPSVLRHNYNRLFQAIRVEGIVIEAAVPIPDEPVVSPPGASAATPPAEKAEKSAAPASAPAAPTSVPAATPPTIPASTPTPPAEEKKPTEEKKPGNAPLEIKPYL